VRPARADTSALFVHQRCVASATAVQTVVWNQAMPAPRPPLTVFRVIRVEIFGSSPRAEFQDCVSTQSSRRSLPDPSARSKIRETGRCRVRIEEVDVADGPSLDGAQKTGGFEKLGWLLGGLRPASRPLTAWAMTPSEHLWDLCVVLGCRF